MKSLEKVIMNYKSKHFALVKDFDNEFFMSIKLDCGHWVRIYIDETNEDEVCFEFCDLKELRDLLNEVIGED